MIGMPFNLQLLEAGGGEEVVAAGISSSSSSFACGGGGGARFPIDKKRKQKVFEGSEPTSVLDSRRSPSPPTSSSTLSSSLGGGGGSSDSAGVAAVSETNPKWPPLSSPRRDAWAPPELLPVPAGLDMGGAGTADKLGAEDWEAILSMPPASPSQEQTFFQWVMADAAAGGDSTAGGDFKQHHLSDFDGGTGFGVVDTGFGFDPIGAMAGGGGFPLMSCGGAGEVKDSSFGATTNLNPAFPPASNIGNTMDDKQQQQQQQLLFGPGIVLNNQQFHSAAGSAFCLPHLNLSPQPNRHHTAAVVEPTCRIPPKAAALPVPPAPPDPYLRRPNQPGFPPAAAPPYHLQQRQMKLSSTPAEESAAAAQQQQALVDHLFQAAELIEAGNPVSARGILARLNHQLPLPLGKPLLRSAFYFKEALRLVADNPKSSTYLHRTPVSTPLDVVLKLGTYNAFSEVSPVLQFTNFTCIQALLEELSGSHRIHIIDFDIGVGGQWSSFMQELAQRNCSSPAGTAAPSLKITAFASASSHHPLELHLTRENLTHFAADLGIPFEFNILNLDPFDPALLLGMCGGMDEAIAVNLPVGCVYNPPVPTLLRLLKQLSPKIVVSVDNGCHRSDLTFSNQFLHAFQSCTVLLDSIDAAGTDPDVSNKIERFLVQTRIENALLGRAHVAGDKMPPWRTLFAAAGFVPVQFSNFTETQAECLLRRVQVRGFHVEKRQASLVLFWQRGELVSLSAWRC